MYDVSGDDKPFLLSGSSIPFAQGQNQSVVSVYVCACVRACVRVCVRVCVGAHVHIHTLICICCLIDRKKFFWCVTWKMTDMNVLSSQT